MKSFCLGHTCGQEEEEALVPRSVEFSFLEFSFIWLAPGVSGSSSLSATTFRLVIPL